MRTSFFAIPALTPYASALALALASPAHAADGGRASLGDMAESSAIPAAKPSLRALTVGGGPQPSMNQFAIERNVHYFARLLPAGAAHRVLFADGRTSSTTVQVLTGGALIYRRPTLPRIDGPTTEAGLSAMWQSYVLPEARREPSSPFLFYFTGHGTPNHATLDDNRFDYWGGGGLHVTNLARKLAELPIKTPVVVVMAQCFSGSFANLLFEGGDPEGAVVERDFVGFFAATRDLPASGCTPEVNEESYQDFSSYFFAALSGRDRAGRVVRGADFDGNGRVGMDEAYAFAVLNQQSEDVPVSTSDVFLRRFVEKPDVETMLTPWSDVTSWARPAERAALEGLSRELGIRGEARLAKAYDLHFGARHRFRRAFESGTVHAKRLRLIRLAKSVVLAHELERSGDAATRARFRRLRRAEADNPLLPRPADAARAAALALAL